MVCNDERNCTRSAVSLLFRIDRSYVEQYVICLAPMTILVLTLGLNELKWVKTVFSKIPKASLSVLLGILIGLVAHFALDMGLEERGVAAMSKSHLLDLCFVLYMTDAAYTITSLNFVQQMVPILAFALCTSALSIGLTAAVLWAFFRDVYATTFLGWFLVAVIINAVDHSNLYSVLHEMHVMPSFLGFVVGEAVVCDAFSISIFYTLHRGFDAVSLPGVWVALALLLHPLIESVLGIIYGTFSVKLCKVMTGQISFMTPAVLLVFQALGYVNARFFGMGGMFTLLTCGGIQKRYGQANLDDNSKLLVHGVVHVGSYLAEMCVAIFVGLEFVAILESSGFHFKPIFLTVLCTILFRFSAVFWIGIAFNRLWMPYQVSTNEIFCMGYGSLRGTITYLLSVQLTLDDRPFLHSTLIAAVIYFALIHGPMSRLVTNLTVKQKPLKNQPLLSLTVEKVAEFTMNGMRSIKGLSLPSSLQLVLGRLDLDYLRPFLQRDLSAGNAFLQRLHKNESQFVKMFRDPSLMGIINYAQFLIETKKREPLETARKRPQAGDLKDRLQQVSMDMSLPEKTARLQNYFEGIRPENFKELNRKIRRRRRGEWRHRANFATLIVSPLFSAQIWQPSPKKECNFFAIKMSIWFLRNVTRAFP